MKAREDPEAESLDPSLPPWLSRPKDAPAYYGFPLLVGSEIDGWTFGVITDPNGNEPASWGDAYVVAPDGSRAGIIWSMEGPSISVAMEPNETTWGVYGVRFELPVRSDADLVKNLHSVLHLLQVAYEQVLARRLG